MRRARLLISAELIEDFTHAPNKPFRVERMESNPRDINTVWMVIEGDSLPKECSEDGELREVTCDVTQTTGRLVYDVQLAKKPQPSPEADRLFGDLFKMHAEGKSILQGVHGRTVMLPEGMTYTPPDPYAGLRVVATVFYGGRVYEVMGPKEMSHDELASFRGHFRQCLDDIRETGQPLIMSGGADGLRVREVAVRAETGYATTPALHSSREIADFWVEKMGDAKPMFPVLVPTSVTLTGTFDEKISPEVMAKLISVRSVCPICEGKKCAVRDLKDCPRCKGGSLIAEDDSPAPVTVRSEE